MYIVLITILFIFVIKFIPWCSKRNKFIKCLEKIPGPPSLPFIGNALDLRTPRAVFEKFVEYQKTYGGIVKICSGQIPNILLVTDYKLTSFILNSTTILGKAPKYQYLEKWLGTGLLLSNGEKWKNRRKIITPTFHFQILEQFLEAFNFNNMMLLDKLKKEVGMSSTDIYPYLKLYALDIICESAMGTYVGAQENPNLDYVQSVKSLCRIFVERTFNPFLQYPFLYMFTKRYRTERKCIKIVHDYTNSIINRRKTELINKSDRSNFHLNKKMVFLDLLLQQRENGHLLTDEDIREEVDVFMFEGHDTLTSALGFILYSLAENPEVQNNVIDELRNIFANDKFRNSTMKDLRDMKYLEAVIKESLRLYPSVPAYGRCLPEDINYDGTILPQGTAVVLFAYGIHRDPAIYPEPEKFLPERFFYENTAKKLPYSYIPFSAGPRNCIGQKYAMLQMKSVISALLRHYELLPTNPKHNLDLVIETVLKSNNGICVRLAKRSF